MNRVDEVMEIINKDIPSEEKKYLLQNLLIDFKNEMEAEDQNMHPEVRTRLAEAYQIAKQYMLENEQTKD